MLCLPTEEWNASCRVTVYKPCYVTVYWLVMNDKSTDLCVLHAQVMLFRSIDFTVAHNTTQWQNKIINTLNFRGQYRDCMLENQWKVTSAFYLHSSSLIWDILLHNNNLFCVRFSIAFYPLLSKVQVKMCDSILVQCGLLFKYMLNNSCKPSLLQFSFILSQALGICFGFRNY